MIHKLNKSSFIIIAIVIILLIFSGILGLLWIHKTKNESAIINNAENIIKEKWYQNYNLRNFNDTKYHHVFNYSDIKNPKYYYVYTTGFNEPWNIDNTYFTKFELQLNGFNIELKSEPSVDYSVNSRTDSFNNITHLLQTKSFSEIEKMDEGRYISDGTPEPTLEEIQKNKEAEKRNQEVWDEIDAFYNLPVEDRIAQRKSIIESEQAQYLYTECLKYENTPSSELPIKLYNAIIEVYSKADDGCKTPIRFHENLLTELKEFEQELAEKNTQR